MIIVWEDYNSEKTREQKETTIHGLALGISIIIVFIGLLYAIVHEETTKNDPKPVLMQFIPPLIHLVSKDCPTLKPLLKEMLKSEGALTIGEKKLIETECYDIKYRRDYQKAIQQLED